MFLLITVNKISNDKSEKVSCQSAMEKDTEHRLSHGQPLTADGTQEHFGVRVTKVSGHDL